MEAPALADVGQLSPEQALELTRTNGTVLCLDVPERVEFGIDLRSYTVGPRFRGVKMVPPGGLHLITFGSDIDQSGIFVRIRPAMTCALRWDASMETLRLVDNAEQLKRLTLSVQSMEHDAFLGPYPLNTEPQWRALSDCVSEKVLRRAGIPVGTLVMPGGIGGDDIDAEIDRARVALAAQDEQGSKPMGTANNIPASNTAANAPTTSGSASRASNVAQGVQPYFEGMARVATFVKLDPRRHPAIEARSGAALSRFHLDKVSLIPVRLRPARLSFHVICIRWKSGFSSPPSET